MAETLRDQKDQAAHLFAQGKWEAALSEYQRVAQAAPEDLTSRQKVAELLQRLDRKPQAIEAYAGVALDWAKQGRLLRAIALCKVILQLEPGHGPTQRMLAELHARQTAPQSLLTPTAAPAAAPAVTVAPMGLPNIPLLSRLGPEAFLAVVEGLELKPFAAGAAIVTEGEKGESMFALVEGHVDVVRQMEGGQRRRVASMGEGEFFGEMALLSDSPRLASVVATERTVVLELTRAQVERIVKHHPSVGQVLQSFHQERLLANVLRGNPLLSALTPLQRESVAQAFQLHSVPAGQSLLVQGQAGQALFLLLRGRCRVVHTHPDGHPSDYPALREGDLFGELSVLLGLPATATVSTETPCTLLRLERSAVERLVLINAGVREALSKLSSERLQRTARLLSGHEVLEGDQRV